MTFLHRLLNVQWSTQSFSCSLYDIGNGIYLSLYFSCSTLNFNTQIKGSLLIQLPLWDQLQQSVLIHLVICCFVCSVLLKSLVFTSIKHCTSFCRWTLYQYWNSSSMLITGHPISFNSLLYDCVGSCTINSHWAQY